MSPAVKESASTEEKFQAALAVIQKLPKEGPAKPSYDVMLKFYSFYKQATEGPCTKPKPWSFDVVNKAKWDYWSKLGNMSKEDAMMNYVEALKKQIEEVPATESMSDFMGVLGKFYNVAEIEPPKSFTDEFDLANSVKATPSSESFSMVNNKVKEVEEDKEIQSFKGSTEYETDVHPESRSTKRQIESPGITSDEDDFCDTSDVFDNNDLDTTKVAVEQIGTLEEERHPHKLQSSESATGTDRINLQVYDQIHASVASLQKDIDNLYSRLRVVEKCMNDGKKVVEAKKPRRNYPSWWPLKDLSPGTAIIIFTWPFVVHWIITLLQRRKKCNNF